MYVFCILVVLILIVYLKRPTYKNQYKNQHLYPTNLHTCHLHDLNDINIRTHGEAFYVEGYNPRVPHANKLHKFSNHAVILKSKTGNFGHFSVLNSSIVIFNLDTNTMRYADTNACVPVHTLRHMTVKSAVKEFHTPSPVYPVKYLRSSYEQQYRERICQSLGVDSNQVLNFTVYMSNLGALTNFHFDANGGLLHQIKGRKRVRLVEDGRYNHLLQPEEQTVWSSCYRRSDNSGEASEDLLKQIQYTEIVLLPHQTLFIPQKMWHEVKSLDEPTIGTVLRYAE